MVTFLESYIMIFGRSGIQSVEVPSGLWQYTHWRFGVAFLYSASNPYISFITC